MLQRALNSSTRIYKHLDHYVGQYYFKDGFKRSKIMWIFKARCDLIYLNGSSRNAPSNCTLCNLNECETLEHFMGRCPILKPYRIANFGKARLLKEEIIDALNGINDINWNNLVKYITSALSYRKLIMDEFNT